jgi:DNA-binding XRE family transcriptional regulator
LPCHPFRTLGEYTIIHHKEEIMEILTWQARTEKNITLKQLEKMTGISKTTLNTIENGQTSPTLRQLEAIAIALDTKISALYDSEYK